MRYILAFWFTAAIFFSEAQNDYPDCSNRYFKDHKVSTSLCFDRDKRFGKAIAYNRKGELIYERELRTIGGHSTVWFSYHENGAVKKAEWRSAPDAGIQWYSNVTTFSDEGKILSSIDNNYDSFLHTTIQVVPGK